MLRELKRTSLLERLFFCFKSNHCINNCIKVDTTYCCFPGKKNLPVDAILAWLCCHPIDTLLHNCHYQLSLPTMPSALVGWDRWGLLSNDVACLWCLMPLLAETAGACWKTIRHSPAMSCALVLGQDPWGLQYKARPPSRTHVGHDHWWLAVKKLGLVACQSLVPILAMTAVGLLPSCC